LGTKAVNSLKNSHESEHCDSIDSEEIIVTSTVTQKNKTIVWDFWQQLNKAKAHNLGTVLRRHLPEYAHWNGPHPIGPLYGLDAIVGEFWQPLLRSFPDLQRDTTIFFGGQSNGRADGLFDGKEWVCGLGHFIGTFKKDWLTIPASGKKTQIRWSEFCRLHEGKIVEIYILMDIPDVMRQAGFPVVPTGSWRSGLVASATRQRRCVTRAPRRAGVTAKPGSD